ncbi:MAG TPA: AI-2E family transporter [Geomonas sp.]|nr:AI-2E family transporter [Geomonas sp.]
MQRDLVWSYVLSILAAVVVLRFHLLPTVLAGLAVHVVTCRLARRLPIKREGGAQEAAVIALAVAVVATFIAAGFALYSLMKGFQGFSVLMEASAETLEKVRRSLPESIALVLPGSADELRENVVSFLREHGKGLSSAGAEGLITFAHILIGMVIGGMTSIARVAIAEDGHPFLARLYGRARMLTGSFEKVVFAQLKISLVNTALTACYLAVILPLFGVRLPMVTLLVVVTFVAGLIPVIGNLISNSAIVILSLGTSPMVAVASLIFLVVVHKLEYFLNAKIIGHEVNARAWELLCAMVTLEAVFGLHGVIAAPILYAWLKAELCNAD